MKFSDLLTDEKKVKVQGVNIVLKKHSVGFLQKKHIKLLENYTTPENEEEKKRFIGSSTDLNSLFVDEAMDSLVSWDVENDDGSVVPITEEYLSKLATCNDLFCIELLGEIMNFNQELPKSKKKS